MEGSEHTGETPAYGSLAAIRKERDEWALLARGRLSELNAANTRILELERLLGDPGSVLLDAEQAADTLALLEAIVERCYSSHHDLYDEAYALRSWFRPKRKS